MLNQLLHLYRKHRTNTPLEDFTTEVFVGLLNLEDEIKESFIVDFLQLPKDDYQLKTQIKYSLENEMDCIVDFILESDNLICFVENKVNSNEGHRQLERYGSVLETYAKNGLGTKLFYCTKYFDDKKYEGHNFQQIRWFQIASFLNPYRANTLVNEFVNFLISNDMAQELTFDTKDLLTLENLQNIFKVTNDYLQRVKPIFEKSFISNIKISDGRSTSQILNHNRLIYMFKDILGQNGWSEIKYGFELHSPAIYVSIWVDKSNNQYEIFKKSTETLPADFVINNRTNGISIEIKRGISTFLNDEESDSLIANWYKSSFSQFSEFIRSTPHMDWKIKVT